MNRPTEIRRVRGEYTGSATVGRAVEVVCFTDVTVYDQYRAAGVISDRQHEAIERLDALRLAAGLEPRVCGRYGADTGRADDAEASEARKDLHAALALLSRDEEWAVMDVLWGSALPRFRMPTLRAALDVLVAIGERT